MKFWFWKSESKNTLLIKRIFLSILLWCAILFLIKSVRLGFSIKNIRTNWFHHPIEVGSLAIGWFTKSVWYAWILSEKILSSGMSSLSKEEFSHLFSFLTKDNLYTFIPQRFSHLTSLLWEIWKYEEDVYSLLWYSTPQRYLIVLQNTSEKRPNWWFFWSFADVVIEKWEIASLQITDSYLPGYDNPNTSILWPEWFNEFLPEREIYFVWANKVWFTYHDGAHIKTLYEKSYPWQKIRGVAFLTTDMFKKILPDFEEQLRERQFVNASVDLIRWEDRWGKKEVYLKSSQAFFEKRKTELVAGLIEKLPSILDNHRINFYLTDITGPFHWFLRRNKLTTRFEQETAYFWDSNISYNKIDWFVTKRITCFDEQENVALETVNQDIISLLPLTPWERTCKISNKLFVDQEHTLRVRTLESQYGIELWAREEHILGLTPTWDTRGVVHFPKNISLFQITGDTYQSELFETPFSNALMYKSTIGENWWTANIFIRFRVENTEN